MRSRTRPQRRRRGAAAVVAAVAAIAVHAATVTAQPDEGPAGLADDRPADRGNPVVPAGRAGDSDDELQAAVDEDGPIRVIVRTRTPVTPETELRPAEVGAQRAEIDRALDALAASVDETESRVITEFEVIPAAVLEVDGAGLDALSEHPEVESITVDEEVPLALDSSTGVIGSDQVDGAGVIGDNFQGSTGGPFEVAILDTGVHNDHEAFTGRIVSQACYSSGGGCPNGTNQQLGGNAGDRCTYSTQCDHGTHVAGIAAGGAYPDGGHEGVARGAGVVAIQIGHRSTTCASNEPNPCWRAFLSNIDLALQRVLTLHNGGRDLRAVNLSLGAQLYSTHGDCDAAFPNTKDITAQLQEAGVLVIAAAGNANSTTQVAYPACLSSTLAIGATDDADTPWSGANVGTNSGELLDLWAPGVTVNAPTVSSSTARTNKTGTSMAAPHVAGATALLAECIDPATQLPQGTDQIVEDLLATGPLVSRSGVSRRRIDVHAAAIRNVPNNDFQAARVLSGSGPLDDQAWNVCADSQPGEPSVGTPENTIWWTWTAPGTGTATISTNDGGNNVTTFNTQLGVFTGDALQSLELVAHDHNGGTGTRSKVVVPVNAGTTYRIRVDGRHGENGLVNASLHFTNSSFECRGATATIVGTAGDDIIFGTGGDDVIVTSAGDDVVHSYGGNDRICLGAGNDEGYGGAGDDILVGAGGHDELRGGTGDDIVVGGPGRDVLRGLRGDDTLRGNSGSDRVLGNGGADRIFGGSGADVLGGHAGNDVLRGRRGPDLVYGGKGADRLFGDGGNDTIRGRAGNDAMHGGGRVDECHGAAGIDTATACEQVTGVP